MIQWVYEKANSTGILSYVVTDHPQIQKTVENFGGKVLMVEDETQNGTQRIHLAYKRFLSHLPISYIINLQGDEPLIQPQSLMDLMSFHQKKNVESSIATMVRVVKGELWKFYDPNVVKSIFTVQNNQCHYFSRGPIPSFLDEEKTWYQHIGVYSYTKKALEMFCHSDNLKNSESSLENREKLEQLKALELSIPIYAIPTTQKLIGVDRKEDIARIENINL